MPFDLNAITPAVYFCKVLLEHGHNHSFMYCLWLHLDYSGEGEYLWQRPTVWPFKKMLTSGLEETQGREFPFSKYTGLSLQTLSTPTPPAAPYSPLASSFFIVFCIMLWLPAYLLYEPGVPPFSLWVNFLSLHKHFVHSRCPKHLWNERALKLSHQGLAWESSCLSLLSFSPMEIGMLWEPLDMKTT